MNPADSLLNVVIVGGGIAGLAAAYRLQESARADGLPVTFTLFESSPNLGGKIVTDRKDGFIIEGGPDSFLLQKPWAVELAKAVGLEADLIGTNPDPKRLYVVNHRRLTAMPDGVMLIIPTRFLPFITSPLISLPGKLRMGMDLIIPRRKEDGDESVASFIHRRLGKEALDKLAEPLMSGIHVSDPERQSLLGTFPRFRALEKEYGSLIAGMSAQRRAAQRRAAHSKAAPSRKTEKNNPAGGSWRDSAFVSLRGGMDTLVRALESALTGGSLITACQVTSLVPTPAGYQVATQDGRTTQADAVILAPPAYVSSRLVSPFAPALARALARIRYVSTATVSLAYRGTDVRQLINGVGFIVPSRENHGVSACTITSAKFSGRAPDGHVLLRCFLGGPGREDALDQSDDEMIAAVRSELSALLGLRADPILARVYRWSQGNAQYDVGHLERVQQMHDLCQETPSLFLTGSAYEGIGIPDCIHQGQQAAEKAVAYLSGRSQKIAPALLTGK